MIWTGYGWLGALLVVATHIATKQMLERRLGAGAFLDSWAAQLFCVLVSVGTCWALGRLLNRGLPRKLWDAPSTVKDPVTGALTYQPALGHTVGFVRVEYIGWLQVFVLITLHLERAGFFRH